MIDDGFAVVGQRCHLENRRAFKRAPPPNCEVAHVRAGRMRPTCARAAAGSIFARENTQSEPRRFTCRQWSRMPGWGGLAGRVKRHVPLWNLC